MQARRRTRPARGAHWGGGSRGSGRQSSSRPILSASVTDTTGLGRGSSRRRSPARRAGRRSVHHLVRLAGKRPAAQPSRRSRAGRRRAGRRRCRPLPRRWRPPGPGWSPGLDRRDPARPGTALQVWIANVVEDDEGLPAGEPPARAAATSSTVAGNRAPTAPLQDLAGTGERLKDGPHASHTMPSENGARLRVERAKAAATVLFPTPAVPNSAAPRGARPASAGRCLSTPRTHQGGRRAPSDRAHAGAVAAPHDRCPAGAPPRTTAGRARRQRSHRPR